MAVLTKYTNYFYGSANPSSSGNNLLLAGVTGQRIRVVSILLVASSAVTVVFKSNTTSISGDYALVANSGFSANFAGGIFVTNKGEALNISLSTGVQVGVNFTYEYIT